MKKIISFSVFGENSLYLYGAERNILLHKEIYTDYMLRFYVDSFTKYNYLQKYIKENSVEISIVKTWSNSKHFWRLLTICDDVKNDDIFLFRDTDSRIFSREYSAVKEFEDSNKEFHLMFDHKNHTSKIMGGMWGIKGNAVNGNNLKSIILNRFIENEKGNFYKKFIGRYKDGDQYFLSQNIYPFTIGKSLIHSRFFKENSSQFTEIYNSPHFVGQAYDENEKPIWKDK